MREAVGVDAARRDAVDGDSLRAELVRQLLQPAGETGAEEVRQREVLRRLLRGERRDRDDPPAVALLEVRQAEPDQPERRLVGLSLAHHETRDGGRLVART